jgi:hypothetical protein
MARFIPDGVLRIALVDTIEDRTAPTLAEVGAGDDITGFIRGISTPLEGSTVDVSDILSKYNKTAPGTYGGQPVTIDGYRDDVYANDTLWNKLARGTRSNLVIARRGGSGDVEHPDGEGAITTGDYVDVWPIEVISRNPADYSRNEPTGFQVSASVPEEPAEDVQVVAGPA